MDYEQTTDEDGNTSEEEDWMDTTWDTIQAEGSRMSKQPESYTETGAGSKGVKAEDGRVPLLTRMQLNDHKAGMQGLDKERINQIIFEVSKGSKFFENERKKEEQVRQRIEEQEKHRRKISDSELQKGKSEADLLVAQLTASRDLTQTIVHVDMDAFYAAVAMRDNPSLRDKPMAVGSMGMLSTSNYEARKYGVRAAMPGFIGKKLCPQLVLVPLNFPRYNEICHQVRDVFANYDPNFCPMSLDEAYLNFTEHLEKRQTMTVTERSVVRRCQSPADATLCRCDLNLTIGKYVLKEGSLQKPVVSQSGSCLSDGDVNANTEKMKENEAEKDTDSGTLRAEEQPSSSAAVTDRNIIADVVEMNTSSVVEDRASVNIVSRPDVHSVPVVERRKGEPAESSKGPKTAESSKETRTVDSIAVEAGSSCYSCGKPVPRYEVVTFGQDVESAVQEMRCRIEQRTCLTASAGIAPNMMLSKVCSDQNKPNGQFYLPANVDDIMQFVHNLPIRKISGIGRVTEQLLGALGISTCKELYDQRALLYHLYSSVSFSYFMRVACGIGSTQVASAREEERKSMSTEQTFGELSRAEDLYRKCQELCHCLAEDLAKEQLVGKTVSLKLKTTDFQVRTRAQTINNYVGSAEDIFAVAKSILRAEILAESPKPLRLRLMGVRLSKLLPQSECPQERQDTILGFFKKTAASPCKARKQGPAAASTDHASVSGRGMSSVLQQSSTVAEAPTSPSSPGKVKQQDNASAPAGKTSLSQLSPNKSSKPVSVSQSVDKSSRALPIPGKDQSQSVKVLFKNGGSSIRESPTKTLSERIPLSSDCNPCTSYLASTQAEDQSHGDSLLVGKQEGNLSNRHKDMGPSTSDVGIPSKLGRTDVQFSQDSSTFSGNSKNDRDSGNTVGKTGMSLTESLQVSTNSKVEGQNVSRLEPPITSVGQVKDTAVHTVSIAISRNEMGNPRDFAGVQNSDPEHLKNEYKTDSFESHRDGSWKRGDGIDELEDAASTSVSLRDREESCGPSTSAQAISQHSEAGHVTESSLWYSREPAFTCPVCCKPVNCINLTDFNAHIDKCLQQDSTPSATSKPKQLAGSQQVAKPKNSLSAAKSKHSSKTQQTSAGEMTKNSPSVSRVNSPQSACSRGSASVQLKSLSDEREATRPQRVGSSLVNGGGEKLNSSGVANTQTNSIQTSGNTSTTTFSSPAENSLNGDLDSPDYMVCPLCGAERADWTLDTFNQHVDACLNRDTISKILQEQRSSEEQIRKRPSSSQQEENKSSQQSKKAKKSQSPRPERSILSFFKN